jgi:Holliday junction resolvase-like predicted endonuclease
MRTDAQRTGDAAEEVVAADLRQRGWTILGIRVRVGRGDLDIVGVDPGPPRELGVVEVRWRGRRDFGLAEETVDHRKRFHLRTALGRLRGDGRFPDGTPLPGLPVRFDLVAVEPGRVFGEPFRLRHHRGISI